MKRARKSKTPRWKDGSARTHLLSTCVRLHMRILTMSLKIIGGGSQRGLWCTQEVIAKCFHANVCILQHVFYKKNASYRRLRGLCKFLYERFGGKTVSWWIQQRGAMRWPSARARARVGRLPPALAARGRRRVSPPSPTDSCAAAGRGARPPWPRASRCVRRPVARRRGGDTTPVTGLRWPPAPAPARGGRRPRGRRPPWRRACPWGVGGVPVPP